MANSHNEDKELDLRESEYILRDSRDVSILFFSNNTVSYPNQYPQHVHSILEISIIKDGYGTYSIGEYTYSFQPGDVFLISSCEPHRIILKPGQFVVNTVIHFEAFFLHDFISHYGSTGLLNILFRRIPGFSNQLDAGLPITQRIVGYINSIEQELREKKPHYHLYVKVLLESVFCALMRTFQPNEGPDYDQFLKKDLYNIDKTLQFINFNLNEQITLNELAGIAHVSPAYFSSIFNRYMGVPPFEYIARKRVEIACHLIRNSSKTLTEISASSGFNNYTSFSNTFRKHVGCSPSEYRKSPGLFNYMSK